MCDLRVCRQLWAELPKFQPKSQPPFPAAESQLIRGSISATYILIKGYYCLTFEMQDYNSLVISQEVINKKTAGGGFT
jgi:hypothetical protein